MKPDINRRINDPIPDRSHPVSGIEPNENDNQNANENTKFQGSAQKFTPPSYQQVREYCIERSNAVDPVLFVDYYQSRGWKTGNAPVKDWKAAVRMWEKREVRPVKGAAACREPASKYQQRMDTLTEVLSIINAENQQSDE